MKMLSCSISLRETHFMKFTLKFIFFHTFLKSDIALNDMNGNFDFFPFKSISSIWSSNMASKLTF